MHNVPAQRSGIFFMVLKLYNTLTRSKREFRPIDANNVRMYVCGPTVYDFAHIGNARPVIVFDVLFRLLRHVYGDTHVTYVRNITDVDDKINARALRDFPQLPLNDAIAKVTSATAAQFHQDVAALGCLPPTHEPRATQHIRGMIEVIEKLITRGHAYNAGGEVLFDVRSMPAYGALSGRDLDANKAGARVAVDAHKRDAADFVLWKLSSADEPGWDSPWGRGRPGWHIECSAMSKAFLGETFDIHGGGLDLIFPHHENEIAQSTCASGHSIMANTWMHNGFVQVEGKKMSKSEGNFITINDLLNTDKFGGRSWPGEVLRLAMLKTHYRQPIDFTVEGLFHAEIELKGWRNLLRTALATKAIVSSAVLEALADDLNFSLVMVAVHSLARRAASGNINDNPANAADTLAATLEFLGFHDFVAEATKDASRYHEELRLDITTALNEVLAKGRGFDISWIKTCISLRLAARAAKNWAESDRIRDELAAQGIVLKDNKDGTTTWEVKR